MHGLSFAGSRLVSASRDILACVLPQQSEEFVGLAGTTIRTISQGVIGIAIVQSLFIGIGLKLVGVPNAGVLAGVDPRDPPARLCRRRLSGNPMDLDG
jgi:predicted PurR-regulated permease PerM